MMEQLFKERKEKLHLFKSLRKKRENERKEVPEGLYTKCDFRFYFKVKC